MNAAVIERYIWAIDRDGYAIAPDAVPAGVIDSLVAAVPEVPTDDSQKRRGGRRNLFAQWPAVVELARSPALRQWVTPVLGEGCFAVRAILFDKTCQANWKVPWHQDLTIAVREATSAEGFGPWSMKDGVPHVQPPRGVLEEMLAVRLHLDDCGAEQGPLRVLPGSHREGRLSEAEVHQRSQQPAQACLVRRGGIVAMRPLLLHASSAATAPSRRRVIHLEYAAGPLPGGVQWYERW